LHLKIPGAPAGEQVQEGLNVYLESKRLAFPRFFFLSNDELLDVLSESRDPLRAQPYMRKIFEGVDHLHFEPNLDVRPHQVLPYAFRSLNTFA
jgi:Dynein heavy chain, N-terminal region 2